MGTPSSPGRGAPRAARNSISVYLAAGLIAPVTCVLVLWGLIAGLVLDGRLGWLNATSPSQRMLIGVTVIVGAGLLVVVTIVVRLVWFTRRLAEEISGLTATADDLAGAQLPRIVTALRDGEQVTLDTAGQPDAKIAEVAVAAAAIADLYRAAVAAAVAEAGLRHGLRKILVSLGRRNQSLLHRQLRIIDGLEQQAASPAALADLFTLDHLTTRMRRHAESLTIVSGEAAGRTWSRPVPVIDVMRAAAAEVEDYLRVTVTTESAEAVAASAVTDMIHLLAELIENATMFSPSTTQVEVRGDRVANGFAIEIEDRGLGIPPDQLAEINAKLAHPPEFDAADADRLGLFVAGKLAARYGVQVALTQSAYRGTKAVVMLPDSMVVAPAEPETGTGPAELVMSRTARLNLRAPELLSLAGAILPVSPATGGDRNGAVQAAGAATPGTADAIDVIDAVTAREDVPAPATVHALPRRRTRRGATPDTKPPPAPESPTPERARTLAAALQDSWQRSRGDDDRITDSPTDSEES